MISLHFRASESLIDRLDDLAAERRVDRSRLIRQLLEHGLKDRPRPLSEPLTEEEPLDLLNEKARAGNTAAIKMLLARLEEADPVEDDFAEFEHLLERQPVRDRVDE